MTTGTTHADSTYNPTYTVLMCNNLGNFSGSDGTGDLNGGTCNHANENLQGGAAADSTTSLHIPQGDLNFSSVITFSPPGTTINTLPAGVKVGGLKSEENLGLGNGACNTDTTVNFVLYSVALPNNLANPRASTNLAYPQADGASHRFNHWKVGSVAGVGDPGPTNTNGVNALGNTIAIQDFPEYLLDVFSPTAGGTPVVPEAVYGGLTLVAGTDWIPLYFVQFDSSQAAALNALGGGMHIVQSSEGDPSVSVLTDPSAPPGPSSITDFCSFVDVTTTLLGTGKDTDPTTGADTGGTHVRATSPGSGTRLFIQYNASLRDLDQDGIENDLDTCPKVANTGDPRVAGSGDTDGDGIDNACDTNTPTASGTDVDGDGFFNRQDECPQIADPTQAQGELFQIAPDNGPETDGISDACETGSATYSENGQSVTTSLSTTIANGRYIVKTSVIAKCLGATTAGGTDADADGYCATDSDSAGGGGSDSDANKRNAWSTTLKQAADSDGDGVSDALETFLGTDATKSCAKTGTPGDEVTAGVELDNWPFDFNNDGKVNTSDILQFSAVANNIPFGKVDTAAAGPSGVKIQRFDLNGDGTIGLSDILQFSSAANGIPFNKVCGSFTGTAMSPPVPAWSQQ